MDEIEAAKSLTILSTPLGDEEEKPLIFQPEIEQKKPSPPPQEEEENRDWKILFMDEKIFKKDNENFLTIQCKTRTETPQKIVKKKKI